MTTAYYFSMSIRSMGHREYTRRAALQSIGFGAIGSMAASPGMAQENSGPPDGHRPTDRLQFVEADPDSGFNFPYWLATPESVRSPPVPLLVTMNSAHPGQTNPGGPDEPTPLSKRARSQITSFDQVGVWASEQLGVPQLVPVFPMPNSTHRITQIDRESMLIEGTDLERVDRQLLRMTEHARQEILADTEMHDQLLLWGNSSAGVAAEHMAVLHPGEIMASAVSGTGGVVTLPLETLDSHTLKYPIGVADLEAITGSPFDTEAFDAVNKFYILGAHDTHNLLKFQVPGELPGVWADPAVYETAKAVYGRHMAEDRLPRCQIAFEKAGVSAQFRIYPEMTHDPELAGPDVLEFLRRSIAGEEVSGMGQRLRLPFDRTVALESVEPMVGDQLDFAVSGEYPPPVGLVKYTWAVDDGRSASGPEAAFRFERAGDYDVTLTMETAHGQVADRGMSLMARGDAFGAYQYEVAPPRPEILIGQSVLIEITVTNVGAVTGDRRLELHVDGERTGGADSRGIVLDPGGSQRIPFAHRFLETGTYEVSVPPAYEQTIQVDPRQTQSAKPPSSTASSDDPLQTDGRSAQTPGFGLLAALAGIGVGVGYRLVRDSSDSG